MPENDRKEKLDNLIPYINRQSEIIAPTSLNDYANIKVDREESTVIELIHGSYEFDLERIKAITLKLAKDLKETHSFHFHQVFEMPSDAGPEFNKFIFWWKFKNDFVTLLGLESGLLPNVYTRIAYLDTVNYFFTGFQKLYALGFRRDIYGPASEENKIKVGIETRDVLRDLPKLFSLVIEPNSYDIEHEIWDQESAPTSDTSGSHNLAHIAEYPHSELLSDVLGTVDLTHRLTEALENKEVPWHLVFYPFESKTFYSYRKGDYYSPRAEQVERIKQARQNFIEDLKSINEEIVEAKSANKKYDYEEIVMALKMILVDWASRARISEIYQP